MNDNIDHFFEREREAVPLLVPPSGRFEELQTVARRRRNRNTTVVSAAAAAVVAVIGTGAVLSAQGLGHSHTTVAGPASSSATHSVSASAAAVDPTVPADFRAWSVTFYGTSGWAVGGYACSDGNECVAVLETTNSMASWHTIAKPAYAGEYGMTASNAIVRFVTATDGWMVGSAGVYSSHDGGMHWRPIPVLQSAGIDSLEAHGDYIYALGRDGASLWVSSDAKQDRWTQRAGLALPTAATGTSDAVKDYLDTANRTVAATRVTRSGTTVRVSANNGENWRSVADPCTDNGDGAAQLVSLLDEDTARFVCRDGRMWAEWFDHRHPDKLDGTATVVNGEPFDARSASTNSIGTVVAYSRSGLQGFVNNISGMRVVQPGDFGYVGLTSNTNGIALPATASGDYWVTRDGGTSWIQRSWG